MTEDAQFAAVLAQVIPVALLAAVLEARNGHEARADAPAPTPNPGQTAAQPDSCWRRAGRAIWRSMQPAQTPGQIKRALVLEVAVLTLLVFVEMAALLTADGSRTSFLNWFAGRPGAIGVGVLFVLVAQLYIDNVTEAYRGKGKLDDPQWRQVQAATKIVLWGAVLVGVVAIVVLYIF